MDEDRIAVLHDNAVAMASTALQQRAPQRRHMSAIEVCQRIRDARVEILKIKDNLPIEIRNGYNAGEIKEMEDNLEQLNLKLAKEILGIDLSNLSKVKT